MIFFRKADTSEKRNMQKKKILDNPDKEQGSLKVDEKKNKNKKYFILKFFNFETEINLISTLYSNECYLK